MVRATDLFASDFTEAKFEEEEPTPFCASEIAQFGLHPSCWSDDTPPDTPRFGSPNLLASSCDEVLMDSISRTLERPGDWTECHQFPSKSKSPMWNMESSSQDPICKLVTTSGASATPFEYMKSPVALEFELFALEDLSSDDDFLRDAQNGGKRKQISPDSLEAKKAKARLTRDALASEAQMRLLEPTELPDTKRMTHNVLERKRRNDLKTSYQDLRETIPDLVHQERAPTAQILQKAVEFIEALKQMEEQLAASMAGLRAENERLRALAARP